MLREASYYLRVAAGLARYQCSPRSDAQQRIGAIQEQVRQREQRFLRMARFVLDQKENVYRRLFDLAGCSYADLEAGIQKDGLRAMLTRLLDAGIYVTHDEFRGRTELVRHGRHIRWDAKDLDNPRGRGLNAQSTSGSTGTRVVTAVNNQFLLYREGYETLEMQTMNLEARPRVLVGALLPSAWPIRRQVTWGRLGVPVDRWFAVGDTGTAYRALTALLVTQVKLLGGTGRYPEFLPENDFLPVAECLAQYCAEGRPAYVRTMVSVATRIASAARDHGLDIRGTIFSVSGEPLSPLKRATIESAGARIYSFYGTTEFGTFGFACGRLEGDAVHLLEDGVILVQRRMNEDTPDALFATNLLPWAPRILINMGVDDSAVIEEGTCDCDYHRLGLTMQAHNIFSYGKVTSQGMTIAARDLADLIETVLPERFGGSPGDYQLAEVESLAQCELWLRVSPRAGAVDTARLHQFFLDQVTGIIGGALSERLWTFSHGFRVVVEEPERTATGKVHPLRLLRAVGLLTDTRASRAVV